MRESCSSATHVVNEDLASSARRELGQYFLVSPEKLDTLFGAAKIRATDRVVELGAGAGTIARCVPLRTAPAA